MLDWSAFEEQAHDTLRPQVARLVSLCAEARELTPVVIEGLGSNYPGGAPLSFQVQARLLNRMATELRVVELCSLASYVLPAFTICSVLFEHTHVLVYVDQDDERAREWFEHSKTYKSYPGIEMRKVVRESLRILGRPQDELRVEMEAYENFCMAKHGNPRMLRNFGVVTEPDTVRLALGPFLTVATPRLVRVALHQAVRLHATGLYAFSVHRATDAQVPLAQRIVDLVIAIRSEAPRSDGSE